METFSKALELSGLNSTTSLVLWLMIIFLFILIAAVVIVFRPKAKPQDYNNSSKADKNYPKGF